MFPTKLEEQMDAVLFWLICVLNDKKKLNFLHGRFTANSFVYKIKLLATNLNCFCQTTQETLLHLFLECATTKAFWNSVELSLVSAG